MAENSSEQQVTPTPPLADPKAAGTKPGLQAKDITVITISLVALTISILGFYFQNVRVSYALRATALNPAVGPGSLRCEVAFFNNGNRAALIDTAHWVIVPNDQNTPDFAPEIQHISVPEGLPAVLEPGKILKIPLATKFKTNYLQQHGKAPDGPLANDKAWKKIPVGIRIRFYDFSGQVHTVIINAFDFNLKNDGSTTAPGGTGRVITIR